MLISGIVVAGIGFEAARGKHRPAEIALLLGVARMAVPLVAIGSVLLFICGLWLVGLEKDVGIGTGWVSAAILVLVAAMALGGYGGQSPKAARHLATQLADRGEDVSVELRALLDQRSPRMANYASALLIVVALALMVFKP